MKFGGTSVGSPEAISNVVSIIQDELARGNQLTVVVSAMRGVTDKLIASVYAALDGDKWEYKNLNKKIQEQHDEVIDQLMKATPQRERLQNELHKLLASHLELCSAVNILGEVTPRMLDATVSLGERLSSRLVTGVLQAHGVPARQFDATNLLLTNDTFQDADPLWDETRERIRRHLLPALADGITPVVTGFIGATADGVVTTLGRGGSDYSAAIIAANNDSHELIIWTDVDGVMTTDPRIDKRARVLPNVSYQEAGELAFYGAKVLHPKTVQPIIEKNMPVRVRNTFNPGYTGTIISRESEISGTIIKAVTVVRDVGLLTVSGRGMLGVPGIAGRTFMATAAAGASILMISQSSSEQSFCFTVEEHKAGDVRNQIQQALADEILGRDVNEIAIQTDVSIVTAVGAGMRGTPGVAGRIFTQMGDHRVNVLSIAQGSSECSISFVVSAEQTEQAVMLLHDLALGEMETVR
jgi:bifunctional aspartokinase / homoserine dehydrogenase 1